MSKVKGAKHYESKCVPHFQEGGKVTRTPDGGTQWVRGDSYKTVVPYADRYNVDPDDLKSNRKTKSPKVARGLKETLYYALTPKDKAGVQRQGDIAAKGADAQNQITRKYGDRTRR